MQTLGRESAGTSNSDSFPPKGGNRRLSDHNSEDFQTIPRIAAAKRQFLESTGAETNHGNSQDVYKDQNRTRKIDSCVTIRENVLASPWKVRSHTSSPAPKDCVAVARAGGGVVEESRLTHQRAGDLRNGSNRQRKTPAFPSPSGLGMMLASSRPLCENRTCDAPKVCARSVKSVRFVPRCKS